MQDRLWRFAPHFLLSRLAAVGLLRQCQLIIIGEVGLLLGRQVLATLALWLRVGSDFGGSRNEVLVGSDSSVVWRRMAIVYDVSKYLVMWFLG